MQAIKAFKDVRGVMVRRGDTVDYDAATQAHYLRLGMIAEISIPDDDDAGPETASDDDAGPETASDHQADDKPRRGRPPKQK